MTFLALIAGAAGAHVVATAVLAAVRGLRARPTFHAPPEPASWPSVSVIVPAWREAGTVERCLAALSAVEYPDWEVIVVAGGSDGTFDAACTASANSERVRVIEQAPLGKNAALEAGLKFASGAVIVFLDADSRVTSGWLRALVAPVADGAGASTGRALPVRSSAIAGAEVLERIAAYEVRHQTTLQGSASIAIERRVLDALGGLPEGVHVGVDWDLDARLVEAGIRRAYAREAVVYTERPATLPEFWGNEVRWRRAHLASLLRLRTHFLGTARSAVMSLYIYGLAWVTVAASTGTVLLLVGGPRRLKRRIGATWALFLGWLALRRAAISLEVAAYTRDLRWLALVPVVAGLLFVTFAAICTASITPRRTTRHFKGPRTRSGAA